MPAVIFGSILFYSNLLNDYFCAGIPACSTLIFEVELLGIG
jgi:hypothetical protein